jgi:putative peptide zinc metalloprotease protein
MSTATTVGTSGATLERAEGVELIGELTGSGYRVPPALVRRGDGQTIQLTRLLYTVLEAVDGSRSSEEVAAVVAERTGRGVTAENIDTLVAAQLRPLGLLTRDDGSQPEVKRSNPLLGLRFKYVVSDPDKTRRITAPFAALFAPVLVALIAIAFVVVSGWVLFEKGLAAATHQAFDQPGLLLLVFAVTAVSAGFHEFGHAAAARYGGATPGAMGTGLYLVWPAFYTDVTDSYRLGRAGRVRTDLGGLYFNAIFAVAMFGVWAVSQFDALLLIIAAQVLQMVRQLAPFVRFDGYHILADLTGVPDLYSHIKPTLTGLLPGSWRKPEGRVLKAWARAVVAAWVLVVIPVLALSLGLMVYALPRVAATAWASLGRQWTVLEDNLAAGDAVGISLRILSVLAIALPVLATVYLLVRLVRSVSRGVWRSTDGRPLRRTTAALVAAALVAGLAFAWWPRPDTYVPIQPTERGTVFQGMSVVRSEPVRLPPRLHPGEVGSAQTLWADGAGASGADDSSGVGAADLPTKDAPALALVLVPSDPTSDAPSWVFPFDHPDAPGPGDNQALAVNTTDGSTLYDVAFALVWADGDAVLNKNEAYAFASCTGCTTVAVGFQVVLIVGQADVIIPQNLSGALNYQCLACVTYALAQQLVVTVPETLSADAMARLDEVWARIQAFGAGIRNVPLDRIQAELAAFEAEILDIVAADREQEGRTGSGTGPGTGTTPEPEASVPDEPGTVGGTGAEATPSPDEPGPSDSASPSGSPTPEPTATTDEPGSEATASPSPSATP